LLQPGVPAVEVLTVEKGDLLARLDRLLAGWIRVAQEFTGGRDKFLARSFCGTRRHHFVIALRECGGVGDIGDRSVGEFRDDGEGERRCLLDGCAKFGENLAGKSHPSDLVAKRDDLHFGIEWTTVAGYGIQRFEGEDGIEELHVRAAVQLLDEFTSSL